MGFKVASEQPLSRMTLIINPFSGLTDYWLMYNARGTIPVHHERPNNPNEPSSIKSKIDPKRQNHPLTAHITKIFLPMLH
jgi:hypothetical protein